MSRSDDSIADLLVSTFDTTVRTSLRMVKVPLQFYAELAERWARAVEEALREFGPEPSAVPPGAGAKPAAASKKTARKKARTR